MTHQTMGEATRDAVTVRGHDLTGDLIGRIGFTDMVLLELTGTLHDDAAKTVLDAVLVALTEHGLTPTAVVARLTDLGAPGAMQSAVAAGLLGAGDRFLGALDGCARLLQEWPDDVDDTEHAATLVARMRADGRRVPGLGHPTHTDGDPRTPALYRVADAAGQATTARDRLEMVRAEVERTTGRSLPVNVDGAAAVLLTELGLPWQVCRGVALVARSAGLVGHLLDEQRRPTAAAIWASAEQTAPYQPPDVPK
ncbi:MAG TPA: citryl-CoA lyase [Candidatus Stackebrandtia excrementipullorum]|nr:citryl-CoA lyase [Candidatus Stackebrandtia excrementipullorum]